MSVQIDGDASTAVTDLRFAAGSAPAGTPPAATGVTVMATGVIRQEIHRVKVTFAALTAAALTQDITLWTLPARSRVVRVLARLTTAFSGGAIATATAKVGKGAGAAEYLAASNIFTGATGPYGGAFADLGTGLVDTTRADYNDAAQAVVLRVTTTVGNVNAATAGEVDFYLVTETLP